jgi:hypothetical protein
LFRAYANREIAGIGRVLSVLYAISLQFIGELCVQKEAKKHQGSALRHCPDARQDPSALGGINYSMSPIRRLSPVYHCAA